MCSGEVEARDGLVMGQAQRRVGEARADALCPVIPGFAERAVKGAHKSRPTDLQRLRPSAGDHALDPALTEAQRIGYGPGFQRGPVTTALRVPCCSTLASRSSGRTRAGGMAAVPDPRATTLGEMRDIGIASARDPDVRRTDGTRAINLTFRGTSYARSPTDRDTRVRIAVQLECGRAMGPSKQIEDSLNLRIHQNRGVSAAAT